MSNRLLQVLFTVVPFVLIAACSTKPVVRKTDGMSQATQPRESAPKSNALLVYPEDAQEPGSQPSEVFPRPREIEPQVKFWQKVYATWSRSQVAIHDKLYMRLIYEIVQLPDGVGDSLTPGQKEYVQARLDDWKRQLGELEYKLAAGATLSANEQGLLRQMEQITGDRNAIFGASQRLRQQRGLRERFKKGLVIGSRYDRQYREIFRNAGLPEDLAYLPHVESSFQFNAHSSAGALGVWQFTAGAARMFMDGDDSAEARLDPIASTYGAARYLSHAYHKLGSWPLAVTSYNHGIGGMQRAKNRYGHDFPRIVKEYDHPLFGFASRNYYAEFLAARDIASEPKRFFPEGLNNEGSIDWVDDGSARKTAFTAPSAARQIEPIPVKVTGAEAIETPQFVPPPQVPKPRMTPPLKTTSSVTPPVPFKEERLAKAEPRKAAPGKSRKARPSDSPKIARVESRKPDGALGALKVAETKPAPAIARQGVTHPHAPRQTSVLKVVAKSQPRAIPVGYRAEHRPEPTAKPSPKSR